MVQMEDKVEDASRIWLVPTSTERGFRALLISSYVCLPPLAPRKTCFLKSLRWGSLVRGRRRQSRSQNRSYELQNQVLYMIPPMNCSFLTDRRKNQNLCKSPGFPRAKFSEKVNSHQRNRLWKPNPISIALAGEGSQGLTF